MNHRKQSLMASRELLKSMDDEVFFQEYLEIMVTHGDGYPISEFLSNRTSDEAMWSLLELMFDDMVWVKMITPYQNENGFSDCNSAEACNDECYQISLAA